MSDTTKKQDVQSIVENTSIADVYRAAKQLDGVAKKTELIFSPHFSAACGNEVFIKPEKSAAATCIKYFLQFFTSFSYFCTEIRYVNSYYNCI